MRTRILLSILPLLLLTVAHGAPPDVVYLFDDIDRPMEAVDAGHITRDIKLTAGSHISEEEPRFGKGSLLIQGGQRAATAGWYAPLESVLEFADETEKMTMTLWIRATEVGSVPLVRRSQFSGKDPGTFGFHLDGVGRLVFSIDKQKVQSAPIGLQAGQWTHLAVTFDKGAVIFYVNGEEAASMPIEVEKVPMASLKGSFSGFLNAPVGLFADDFGFFGNRTLTADDIKQLYQEGLEKWMQKKQ